MKTKTLEDREYWIDAIRSFACLCVITTHAPIPNCGSGEGLISIFNYYSVGGASILFFMISGALIFNKPQNMFPFIKTRFMRVFFPMVFWTVVYLAIELIRGKISFVELIKSILLIPFYPQQGTFWFIYVIFGIYLLTPMVSTWLNKCKKSDLEFFMAFWCFTLFLPYLEYFLPDLSKITIITGILYYFSGYIGFAILGVYLRRYMTFSFSSLLSLFICIVIVSFPWFLYYFTDIPHSIIQNRMSINHVFLATLYFLMIKAIRFSPRMKLLFYDFAQHTFGIYLVHIIVMKRLLWPLLTPLNIHYIIQIPLITILTAIISYLIVHIFSKLPFSKYTVSYSS